MPDLEDKEGEVGSSVCRIRSQLMSSVDCIAQGRASWAP